MIVSDKIDYESILEHIPGAIVVDVGGRVIYMNDQCAEYMGVDRGIAVGNDIIGVFPETKMMENMDIDKPRIVFYNSFGFGISMHIPLFKKENALGCWNMILVSHPS